MSTSNQQTLVDSGANERPTMLERGNYIPCHVRHSRLMDEFDKFATKEGESLESVYERLTTLVNIMDHNNVFPIPVSINTKFLNCLQPEWSKYVTMVRHNQTGDTVSYDLLYDSLVQFESHVLASKAKKAAKNHDPLAFLVHSNASSSLSHANSSYSPSFISCYGRNGNRNAGRQNKNQAFNAGNGNNDGNQIVHRVSRTASTPRKANYGEEIMEELTDAVMLMAQIQPADGNTETVPSYDAKAVSEVNVHPSFMNKTRKWYLEDIVNLEEKLSSQDRIVYKMGQSIQIIHMLGKTPNKVYDPFLKVGLGYKNLKRLKKAIAAQPKMYDGEMLHSAKLNIDSPDSEETL
ncbi:hypothetical protein Tco_1105570 [Tanacetum coccineum]